MWNNHEVKKLGRFLLKDKLECGKVILNFEKCLKFVKLKVDLYCVNEIEF